MKLSEMKPNFTCDETKQNFAKYAKFHKTDDEFCLVSCFVKLIKHAKLETLGTPLPASIYRRKGCIVYTYRGCL
jgi:hypothetical protein